MSQPSIPISFPIKTLEDLESRAYFNSFHFPFNKASVPLSPSSSLPDKRRLLVCHDMAGGYGDDKWVQGGSNPEAYDITHWYLMDVFVYFAHSLVTLPPPCWTNTAHSHGVKVLGTFICEWEEGQKIANEMLSTIDSAQLYAERLTELAAVLGFDGWLLNMEVNLELSKIPILKEFVDHLTKTMHREVPGSLVIWYDSITIDGRLNWQNRLNDKNKPFFDLCDGIFVNYTWQAHFPELSAVEAGDRKYDVYMGIDVFGRGTFGGGQWNTNFALDLLKRVDISAALFAPGWVYETNQPPNPQTAKAIWWGLVEGSWGVAQNCIRALPFYSNFDQGNGYHFSVDGKQVSDIPWNNISCQGVQPFMKFAPDNPLQVYIDNKESSYSGGSSIIFKGNIDYNDYLMVKLFTGDVLIGDSPIQFSYSVKLEDDALLDIYSVFSDPNTRENTTVLLSSDSPDRLPSEFGTLLKAQQIGSTPAPLGWVLQEYEVSTMGGKRLTHIGAGVHRSSSEGPPKYSAALGHFLAAAPGDFVFPPAGSWAVQGVDVEWTGSDDFVSVKIDWKLLEAGGTEVAWFPSYNVYGEAEGRGGQKFLGVAHVRSFYVDRFAAPLGRVNFVIQPCAADGSVQKLGNSPSLRLEKPGNL